MIVYQKDLFIISSTCVNTPKTIIKVWSDLPLGTNLFKTSIKKPPSHLSKYANLNGRSNTIYKIVGFEGLRNTLYRYTKVNNDLNTQLSLIISDVLTLNCACNVLEYFKDGGPMPTGQSQNAVCYWEWHLTDVTLKSWELMHNTEVFLISLILINPA